MRADSSLALGMTLPMRFWGAWGELAPTERKALLRRDVLLSDNVRLQVAAIVKDVRARGDAALLELAARLDGVTLESLEVPRREIAGAVDSVDAGVRRALERAATNIAAVHDAFRPREQCVSPEPGITILRRPDPLARVGVYAPGGRVPYPSSVLMGAVPAKVGGVREVVLCSPPDATGRPAIPVLAAAAIAEVDRVFSVGGAGAIAAMAFGTDSVPRADRIVGPGNAWVAAAKLLVVGHVAIDAPAGPSELVVIADERSDLPAVAREMVAQAEHDPLAMVVALVVGRGTAMALRAALGAALGDAPRGHVVRAAFRNLGGILALDSCDEAVHAASEIAAEHLLIATDDAAHLAGYAGNAGSVFVGATSSVAFGDYMTGANHVLPTGGAARSYSGLSPLDFVRWTTLQFVDRDAAARLSADVATLAMAEALPGHADAARHWGEAPR